jgi:hypothetical protein
MSDRWIYDPTGEVDVFSRGSLLLTFELLRKSQPALALKVRNITGEEPLPREVGDPEDKNSDHFRVRLDCADARAVVQTLMEFTHPDAVDVRNPGINILARTLMQDWLLFAHQQISRLPVDDLSPIVSSHFPSLDS